MSSTVAHILETSTGIRPDGNIDNELLHYSTLNSHTTDILDVVKDVSFLKELAKNEDYRLAPYLISRTMAYDKSMASTRSIRSNMWKYLTTTTTSYQINEKTSGGERPKGFRDMIEGMGNNANH